jgi:hypothetical protein
MTTNPGAQTFQPYDADVLFAASRHQHVRPTDGGICLEQFSGGGFTPTDERA